MENIINYGLFAYLILNFGLTFALPSYRVWKQTGISPITFSNKNTAHDYIGKIFKLLLGLLLLTGGIYAFMPHWVKYLMPVWYLESHNLQILGMAGLFGALAWIAIAQHQMAHSWRIGIDEKHKTHLVTEGVFAISRNPIFLGMLVTLFCVFCLIPNAITLLVLITGVIVVQIQVRLEEEFLIKSHGADYTQFCSKTRRWL